ncbi:emp24/gp25L/p24 family protein [Cryptosporidium felis]|nr:emp24/gp25L/p24 family protein [Cryptosporidium felis]
MLKSTLITLDALAQEEMGIRISDEKNTLFESNEKNTKVAITTIRTGIHQFCLINNSLKENVVSINLKWGPGAYDSGSIANKADLEPLNEILINVNTSLKEYQANIKQMKGLSRTIQNATSTASSRIAAFSVFNILCIVLIGILQTYYIKNFFRSRKLI